MSDQCSEEIRSNSTQSGIVSTDKLDQICTDMLNQFYEIGRTYGRMGLFEAAALVMLFTFEVMVVSSGFDPGLLDATIDGLKMHYQTIVDEFSGNIVAEPSNSE